MDKSAEATALRVKDAGVIAIVRGSFTVDENICLAEAAFAGGVRALELTMNSPAALPALVELRRRFGQEVLLGAGTVRSAGQLAQAAGAGAEFLVSPGLDVEVAHLATGRGLLYVPGVLTPSEVQAAAAAGCRLLKLFPSDALGPGYLRALRAPFDDVEFIPTGGIDAGNVGAYRRAGAVAVGVGGALIGAGVAPDEVQARAARLRAAWEEAGV